MKPSSNTVPTMKPNLQTVCIYHICPETLLVRFATKTNRIYVCPDRNQILIFFINSKVRWSLTIESMQGEPQLAKGGVTQGEPSDRAEFSLKIHAKIKCFCSANNPQLMVVRTQGASVNPYILHIMLQHACAVARELA